MTDGHYTIEVTLKGGTGRAFIESPAVLNIENGIMTAEIVWSSNSYDYMEVNGKEYYPVSGGESSVFVIEIPALDEDIPVLAETLAMSEPHLIEYTLNFHSETIREVQNVPIVPVFAGAAAAAAVICAAFIRKKKR